MVQIGSTDNPVRAKTLTDRVVRTTKKNYGHGIPMFHSGEAGWHALSNAKGVASVIPPATPFGVPQGRATQTEQRRHSASTATGVDREVRLHKKVRHVVSVVCFAFCIVDRSIQ